MTITASTIDGDKPTTQIKDELVVNKDGSQEVRKMCEFGVTLDERIADGFYFAKSVGMIEYILQHPQILNDPISRPIENE